MVTIRGLFRTQTSKTNLFAKIVNGFQRKAPSQMFEWVLNTPLTMVAHTRAYNIVISKLQNLPEKCKNACIIYIY